MDCERNRPRSPVRKTFQSLVNIFIWPYNIRMYIEDVYVKFFDQVLQQGYLYIIQSSDKSAFKNFYNLLILNKPVTEKQSRYILLLLKKYSSYGPSVGFEIEQFLVEPVWKHPFRQIDESKLIYVEHTDTDSWICLKFPYRLIKSFEKEVLSTAEDPVTFWDKEERVRKISLFDYNLINLKDFIHENNFEIDNTFDTFITTVEEIWNQSETVVPHSTLNRNEIVLCNATEEAVEYFNENKSTMNMFDNLLLAKKMGFPLRIPVVNAFDRLVTSDVNQFKVTDFKTFFSVTEKISGRVCIVLDKSENYQEWITKFLACADRAEVPRESIKICFRDDSKTNGDFNNWLRDKGVTGTITDQSKYCVFKSKPAK